MTPYEMKRYMQNLKPDALMQLAACLFFDPDGKKVVEDCATEFNKMY